MEADDFKQINKIRKRRWLLPLIITFLSLVIAFISIPFIIVQTGKYQIYTSVDDVPEYRVGIVFGARVDTKGEPTPMLEDRLIVAAQLYHAGRIEKILVSGDNRFEDYNEPQGMADYLIEELGVTEDDVVLDFAGRRTYDTCARANEIFEIDEAILITQGYHLPRALFLCNNLGVESEGYSATIRDYVGEDYYKTREVLAIYKSFWDAYLFNPEYVGGVQEPI